jgi:hypothetical protein
MFSGVADIFLVLGGPASDVRGGGRVCALTPVVYQVLGIMYYIMYHVSFFFLPASGARRIPRSVYLHHHITPSLSKYDIAPRSRVSCSTLE